MSESKSIRVVVGRFNPPHRGHGALFEYCTEWWTHKQDHLVFTTKTHNIDNPFTFYEKLEWLRKLFPAVIFHDKPEFNLVKICQHVESLGYDYIQVICGSDRLEEYSRILNDYNGKEFDFDKHSVIALDRVEAGNAIESASATKMRQAALADDRDTFFKYAPKDIPAYLKHQYFDAVKKALTRF